MKTTKNVDLKGTVGIAREYKKITKVSTSQLLRELLYSFGVKTFGKKRCEKIMEASLTEVPDKVRRKRGELRALLECQIVAVQESDLFGYTPEQAKDEIEDLEYILGSVNKMSYTELKERCYYEKTELEYLRESGYKSTELTKLLD